MVVGTIETTDAPASGREAASPRCDDGTSFIEIMVTIVLLGTVLVGILAAMRTGVIASSTARESAKVETALLNASDRVSRAPLRCVDNPYSAYVGAAIAPWEGRGAATANVEHLEYDDEDGAFAPMWWVAGPCSSSPGPTVQRITITISGPDGRLTRSMDVIKSSVGGKNV